ncbi:37390357-a625-473e-9b22-160e84ed3b47-CDS [Sclerotinia trifoliorum]|uniref:37390357-a625-473e-9b22-160e84ed3b47-CDS n=1 Tax=Sclerotinia trifoliorum TaxID=28548 RepID=A0A8H2ZVK4_9HELO|nr:37390357-a625-473e-9b22-160e84ed3b47-CDS [Sclerotinia trifoliorum]
MGDSPISMHRHGSLHGYPLGWGGITIILKDFTTLRNRISYLASEPSIIDPGISYLWSDPVVDVIQPPFLHFTRNDSIHKIRYLLLTISNRGRG